MRFTVRAALSSPASGGTTSAGGENSRLLLGGQGPGPLILPPRALLLRVGGVFSFKCSTEGGAPLALFATDSDSGMVCLSANALKGKPLLRDRVFLDSLHRIYTGLGRPGSSVTLPLSATASVQSGGVTVEEFDRQLG